MATMPQRPAQFAATSKLSLSELLSRRYRPIRNLQQAESRSTILAEELATGNHVVLKTDLPDRIRHEVEVLISIPRHVGPKVCDLLWDGAALTVAMEALRGRPFPEVVDTIVEDEWPTLIRDVLIDLHHLHRTGYLHLDIRPENLLVVGEPDGRQLRLIDFGSAYDLRSVTGLDGYRTQVDPSFVAPEILGRWTADARSDLYSLARVLEHSGVRIDEMGLLESALEHSVSSRPKHALEVAQSIEESKRISPSPRLLNFDNRPVVPVRPATRQERPTPPDRRSVILVQGRRGTDPLRAAQMLALTLATGNAEVQTESTQPASGTSSHPGVLIRANEWSPLRPACAEGADEVITLLPLRAKELRTSVDLALTNEVSANIPSSFFDRATGSTSALIRNLQVERGDGAPSLYRIVAPHSWSYPGHSAEADPNVRRGLAHLHVIGPGARRDAAESQLAMSGGDASSWTELENLGAAWEYADHSIGFEQDVDCETEVSAFGPELLQSITPNSDSIENVAHVARIQRQYGLEAESRDLVESMVVEYGENERFQDLDLLFRSWAMDSGLSVRDAFRTEFGGCDPESRSELAYYTALATSQFGSREAILLLQDYCLQDPRFSLNSARILMEYSLPGLSTEGARRRLQELSEFLTPGFVSYYEGRLALRSGDRESATRMINAALEMDADGPEVGLREFQAFLSILRFEEDPEDAVRLMKSAIKLASTKVWRSAMEYNLAMHYERMGQLSSCETHARRSMQLASSAGIRRQERHSRVLLCGMACWTGDLDGAESHLDFAFRSPGTTDSQWSESPVLAQAALVNLQRGAEARAALQAEASWQAAITTAASQLIRTAISIASEVVFDTGRRDLATRLLAIPHLPDRISDLSDATVASIRAFADGQSYDLAIQRIETALEGRASDFQAARLTRLRGRIRMTVGDFSAAANDIAAALERLPSVCGPYARLRWRLDLVEALQVCEPAELDQIVEAARQDGFKGILARSLKLRARISVQPTPKKDV